MNHSEFAALILAALPVTPESLPVIAIDDRRRRNAGRCMTDLICHRLGLSEESPQHVRHTTFTWRGGTFALRNSRITDHHWSTAQDQVVARFHELGKKTPMVYLLTYWDVDSGVLHAWAVPENVAFEAFTRLSRKGQTASKPVEVSPQDHLLKNASGAPSFEPYYSHLTITAAERAKLLEAIKTDDSIKAEREALDDEAAAVEESSEADDAEELDDDERVPTFTEETVAFLEELPARTHDGEWHEQNRSRYERVLRDPCRALVEELRHRYIMPLSPAVAGGKRHLSILKKNDYGKGGYHDHYWFAFYDPAAGSKTKSVQLFVGFHGHERVWRYGLATGTYCGEYLARFQAALVSNRDAVAAYLRKAPSDTRVYLSTEDSEIEESATEFAERLMRSQRGIFDIESELVEINILREFPLATLPDLADTLVDDVGTYFEWNWPFFEAAMTGAWGAVPIVTATAKADDEAVGEVDEKAPKTLVELSDAIALPHVFLADMEEALLAKHQLILVGPPGTSKTYTARQFARYFVRAGQTRPQGISGILYMHANWAYEDFFEGLKPTSKDGFLSFETRKGFFLEWVDSLREYRSSARHVLVLDEINRCDTAAVLGELLQLLEYRGSTVRMLSGRNFVFPENVYIIGTMNSADRSIGRLDLALQRRFFWLNLPPQPDTLDRWLKRPGNNPLGFQACSLQRCNELLSERGIPSEQHIGHALFMLQRVDEDDEASPNLDRPLNARQLRHIVRFSVLPYVRELLTIHFGRGDDALLKRISDELLGCIQPVSPATTETADGSTDA